MSQIRLMKEKTKVSHFGTKLVKYFAKNEFKNHHFLQSFAIHCCVKRRPKKEMAQAARSVN